MLKLDTNFDLNQVLNELSFEYNQILTKPNFDAQFWPMSSLRPGLSSIKWFDASKSFFFYFLQVKATITGGITISTNETEMAQWLLKNGPISIGINANAMQVD